jgi:hypothetical protein
MTIDLEHPAFFNDGAIMKLNEDFSTTEIKTTDKSVDYIRMVDEPIDLIPGGRDNTKEILHLKPGDILLTFRDWNIDPKNRFYRFVIKSEQLSEYFAKLKEYENQQNNQKASITECCDAACPSF